MTARCKFQVTAVTHHSWSADAITVELETRYDEALSKEDRAFAKATPSGKISLSISNPVVHDTFKVGRYVYVDVTPIE